MADPIDDNPNIIIQTYGNTAEMATDWANSCVSFGAAHIPVSKIAWGNSTTGNRVTLDDPLPIQVAGQTGPIEIRGTVQGTTGARIWIANFIEDGLVSAPGGASAFGTHYIAVAGSTNGATPVGVTATVQGTYGGIPVAVTGDVNITGAMASDRGAAGVTSDWVVVGGSSASGYTAVGGFGEVYPGYGYPVPIAVTAGRKLHSDTDSVSITGTINATGGRQLKPSTDSVVVYSTDQTKFIPTYLAEPGGATAGFSGDALKVAITNASGITFSVNLRDTTEVYNADYPRPLRVMGATSGSGADPVIVAGQNAGALEVISSSGLQTTVSNEVNIKDDDIISSLENTSKPLINNLSTIKTNTGLLSNINNQLRTGDLKASISSIQKPRTLRSGSKTVSNNVAQVHNNLQLESGITLKNSPSSESNILVGNSSLANSSDNGYILEPGESIYLEISNLNKVYTKLDSQGPSQARIQYIGS